MDVRLQDEILERQSAFDRSKLAQHAVGFVEQQALCHR